MDTRSLTGDPVTDSLVPVAQQLIGAVRDGDAAAVDEAFAQAILVTGGRCDPGQALAVVCAAMVSDDVRPSQSLQWVRAWAEYDRLVAAGIRESIAVELADVGGEKGRAA